MTVRAAAGLAAIACAAAAMLAWSWGTWPNLLVDFGRELYAPWRLAEGEVLYRDIPWFDGPLSPYWNALVFRVLGVGLRSLVVANLLLVAGLVALVASLFARTAGRAAAFAACLVFVTVFAFSRIDGVGNDNYLTPYSHGVTHGLGLSLLALWLFARRDRRCAVATIGSGLALGLVALTKAEVFLAAAAALAVGWTLDASGRRAAPRGSRAAGVVGFAAAAAAPPIVAFALLSTAMSPATAAAGTLGTWSSLFGSGVASLYFYRDVLGTLHLADNAAAMLRWSVAYAVVVAALAASGRALARGREAGPALAAFAGVAAFVATVSAGDLVEASWPDASRALPVALAALAVAAARGLRGGDASTGGRSREVLWLSLVVFGGALLAKIALRVRLDQYGFALAMPASLVVVAWLVGRLPGRVAARSGDRRCVRAAAAGVVAAVVVSFLPVIGARVAERTAPIGRGGDAFLTEPSHAETAARALAAIDALPADATLAVLPEGVMLNYLTRRRNPTGVLNFMPPEIAVFGEERILAAFEEHPPDFVALTHKDTTEYGVGSFGRGYARALYAWLVRNYEPVALYGDPPLEPGSGFGVRLFARRHGALPDGH